MASSEFHVGEDDRPPPSAPPPPRSTGEDARGNERATRRDGGASNGRHHQQPQLQRGNGKPAAARRATVVDERLDSGGESVAGSFSRENEMMTEKIHMLLDDHLEGLEFWKTVAGARMEAQLRASGREGQSRLQAGGGGDSGGVGGGATGGAVALGNTDLKRLLSRLTAAGPSRIDVLAEIESMAARPRSSQGAWNKRLQELLRACRALKEELNDDTSMMRADVNRLWSLNVKEDEAPAAVVTLPPPIESIRAGLRDWRVGQFYDAFVDRVRQTGDLSALFVAQRVVLDSGKHLRVPGRRLGQGGYGYVDEVSVPAVGLKFAVKTFKVDGESGGPGHPNAINSCRRGHLTEMMALESLPRHPHLSHALAVNDCNRNDMRIYFELASGDFFDCAFGAKRLGRAELLR